MIKIPLTINMNELCTGDLYVNLPVQLDNQLYTLIHIPLIDKLFPYCKGLKDTINE